MSFDVYQAVTDKIDAQLAQGVVPWRKPWHSELGMHRNLQSGRPYRGINQLLTSMSGYDQPLWSTKKGIHKMGGRILDEEFAKPHQGSTLVTLWKRIRVKCASDDPQRGADGKKPAFFLRFYTVWNVQQTEGLEEHWVQPKVVEDADAWLDERVTQAGVIIDDYPQTADMGQPSFSHGGDRAYYAPRVDTVKLPYPEDFDSPASYVGTMFHEFVHSTGHTARLARFKPSEHNVFGDVDYSEEELVAEFGAAMLCSTVDLWGPKNIEQSAAYIDHWRKHISEDKKLLVLAAARAQKAVDYILGRTWDDESKETEREEAVSA